MSESEHFVQFYETDAFLLNSLGGYIYTALSAGEAAIVVATDEHREGLEARLRHHRESGIWWSFTAGRFTLKVRAKDSARHSQSGFLSAIATLA